MEPTQEFNLGARREAPEEPTALTIPLDRLADPDPNFFLKNEEPRALTRHETAWVAEQAKTLEPNQPLPPAPSAPALKALEKTMQRYRGTMPVTKEEWRNYVLDKYFQLSQDLDPKIAKSALDSLAKTSVVGLWQEEQTLNINLRKTEELEGELLSKISRILGKTQKEETPLEVEWREVTDTECSE